jgi:hypothetical protein
MLRVFLGLAVVTSFVAGRTPAVSSGANDSVEDIRVVDAPELDIYGNQVEGAVGRYRVDPLGDLYEEHNPDTAVLELGPPST